MSNCFRSKYKTEEEKLEAKREATRKWRKNNPEKCKKQNKDYNNKRKEKRKEYLEKNKEVISQKRKERYIKNKEHYIKNNNARKKVREATEPLYKFIANVRRNIRRSFSRNNSIKFKKILKSEELLGCTIIEFMNYLLSKCPENTKVSDFHQFGYHLDHIFPISRATTQEEVEKLCHYTNYQPLWWKDNIIKSNKLK